MEQNERKQIMKPKNKPSQVQQHMRDAVDIRTIMERARRTGQQPAPQSPLFYGDFTSVGSYHDTMNRLVSAQNSFMRLPSKIRQRFQNDPGQLLEFLNNKENIQEAIELGILSKIQEPVAEGNKEPEAKPKSKKKEPEPSSDE